MFRGGNWIISQVVDFCFLTTTHKTTLVFFFFSKLLEFFPVCFYCVICGFPVIFIFFKFFMVILLLLATQDISLFLLKTYLVSSLQLGRTHYHY